MSVNYEMPFGPLGSILDKAKFAKSAARGMETALFKVRGLQSLEIKWLCSSIHYTRCIPKTACRKENIERYTSKSTENFNRIDSYRYKIITDREKDITNDLGIKFDIISNIKRAVYIVVEFDKLINDLSKEEF